MGCTTSGPAAFHGRAYSRYGPGKGLLHCWRGSEAEGAGLWPEGPQEPSFHNLYRLSRKVGKGSFASVYLAHPANRDLGEVAVKVIDLRAPRKGGGPAAAPARAASTNGAGNGLSEKRCRDALREAELLRRVSGSERVVRFEGAFHEGGLAYILMERCDVPLLQVLQQQPQLNEAYLRRVLREMLEGLAAVHAAGVVHRDVKPDNFLCVGPGAVVKLCDFGLASLAIQGGEAIGGGLRGVYGTPPFMAPEMLTNAPYCTGVDVWSLGVIGYALLLGDFPYRPEEATGNAMKAAIISGYPEPLFSPPIHVDPLGTCVSKSATAMLRSLLCRQPKERPTAQEALGCGFFKRQDSGEQQASLRPMLMAAIRVGLFQLSQGAPKMTEVDARLAQLQGRHRRPQGLKKLSSFKKSPYVVRGTGNQASTTALNSEVPTQVPSSAELLSDCATDRSGRSP